MADTTITTPPNLALPRYAQELLSTFSTALGEVALQPATGGTFIVSITHQPADATALVTAALWDRRTDGGFPETKELKRRVRDVIAPGRDLGHVDRHDGKKDEAKKDEAKKDEVKTDEVKKDEVGAEVKDEKKECEDCV
ncbi:hypothetical protein G7046_g9480 [Stylonectria norvegica]|nr:hypothetical protein G7046_g9480 [Stylonectria norvegica]